MPDKKGRLTPQEKRFAERYGATGDATYAATVAGYGSPAARASQNLAKPAIVAEARAQARRRLETEGAQIGVAVLIEIAMDAKQPAGARATCATNLVKLSGIAAGDADGKAPHEMTADELASAIEKLERVAADRAKTIEARPEPASDDVFG